MREEIGWAVINGQWKQVRKFVDVANPEGRLIRKEAKLPEEMENTSATIKQTLEQMGLKDILPGPAGAYSATLENTDQIRQLTSLQNVGMIIEGPEGARRISVYPMMIPEQKEESRNDVPSLNSPGYITTGEKSQTTKEFNIIGDAAAQYAFDLQNRGVPIEEIAQRIGKWIGADLSPQDIAEALERYKSEKEESNDLSQIPDEHLLTEIIRRPRETVQEIARRLSESLETKEEIGEATEALSRAAETQSTQAETISAQADQLNQVLEQLRTSVEETKRIADEMKAGAGT